MAAVTGRPLVVFGDAQSAGATALREALAGRFEPYAAGVQVGTRVPGDCSPETPHLPYVLVALDAAAAHASMADARVTLRVTVWHSSADDAHDLAQLAQGLLVVHRGPVLRTVRPATGPLAAVDPDSGVDLSSITVTAHVRPIVL